MAYATLLLHLDDSRHLEARVRAAAALAQRFDSHLVGLSASGNAPFEQSLGAGLLRTAELRQAMAAAQTLARERAQVFDQQARALGLHRFESYVDDADDAPALLHHGLCADLVLMGQPDPAEPGHARSRAQFEEVVLGSAPPVLVLPHDSATPTLGEHVLVAWNETREASRAALAALPLLERAQDVRVVQCEMPLAEPQAASAPATARAAAWLARHGVPARAWPLRSDADPGAALQDLAAHDGIDLIVMGAWGRTRWSERVFGGVTRTLLASSRIPLLLAR